MKPIPLMCERIIKDGQMWCNSHNRLHSLCRGVQPKAPPLGQHHPHLEQIDGKIPARGAKRAFTPSEEE